MSVWSRLAQVVQRWAASPEDPPPRKPLLHWRPIPRIASVACRSEGLHAWTGELEHLRGYENACPECLEVGELIVLQKRTNSR